MPGSDRELFTQLPLTLMLLITPYKFLPNLQNLRAGLGHRAEITPGLWLPASWYKQAVPVSFSETIRQKKNKKSTYSGEKKTWATKQRHANINKLNTCKSLCRLEPGCPLLLSFPVVVFYKSCGHWTPNHNGQRGPKDTFMAGKRSLGFPSYPAPNF